MPRQKAGPDGTPFQIPSRFGEKIRSARKQLHINQTELGERINVTQRSMTDYERNRAFPRSATLKRLAEELGVTVGYLVDDACNDPAWAGASEAERMPAWENNADEMQELLARSTAFFAGGDVPQEDKDAFFNTLMTAYVTARTEAQKRAAHDE